MRCFLAIELPDDIRRQLLHLQERFGLPDGLVRWSRPEQIHLTVKFLGEVPDDRLAELSEAATGAARRSAPFELTVEGTGCFPPGGPARVIWAGVPGPPEPLAACREACEEAFATLDVKREHRAYRPHLTLGRVRALERSREIRAAVAAQSAFHAGSFSVSELVLFQSVLERTGARYNVLSRFAL